MISSCTVAVLASICWPAPQPVLGAARQDVSSPEPAVELTAVELAAKLDELRAEVADATRDEWIDDDLTARGVALVRRAVELEDTTLVPPLRRLAESTPEGHGATLCLPALDALWRLGEPQEYFRDRVYGYAAKPTLAVQCVRVLARVPGQEQVDWFQEIAQLAAQHDARLGSRMQSASCEAPGLVGLARHYETLADLPERIAFLDDLAIRGYSPRLEGVNPYLELGPIAAWAQARLRAEADREPELVVDALRSAAFDQTAEQMRLADSESLERERLLHLCREHAAAHLRASTRVLWRERPRAGR